ncbi:hypothetical protein AB4124_23560 [Paenibacillus sp. 2KB_20]|uniref:hypothetical protein n=1 Tax=Paenibacillus sp. 2KB_20 TaxID=3232977 RepID=UPI003F9BEDC6
MNNINTEIFKKIDNNRTKSHIDTSELIGLNSLLIYSKDIFGKNEEVDEYIKKVFNINFLPYVIRSRTLIFARVSKEIYYYDENQKNSVMKKMIQYFQGNLSDDTTIKKNNSEGKTNANENMKKWMRGLNNQNE